MRYWRLKSHPPQVCRALFCGFQLQFDALQAYVSSQVLVALRDDIGRSFPSWIVSLHISWTNHQVSKAYSDCRHLSSQDFHSCKVYVRTYALHHIEQACNKLCLSSDPCLRRMYPRCEPMWHYQFRCAEQWNAHRPFLSSLAFSWSSPSGRHLIFVPFSFHTNSHMSQKKWIHTSFQMFIGDSRITSDMWCFGRAGDVLFLCFGSKD